MITISGPLPILLACPEVDCSGCYLVGSQNLGVWFSGCAYVGLKHVPFEYPWAFNQLDSFAPEGSVQITVKSGVILFCTKKRKEKRSGSHLLRLTKSFPRCLQELDGVEGNYQKCPLAGSGCVQQQLEASFRSGPYGALSK